MQGEAYARTSDPATSHQAAMGIEPQLNALEKLVYDTVVSLGGATTREISMHTGKDRVTVSPRIKPLCVKGKLEDSGTRRGRSIVWEAIPTTGELF